MKPRVWVPLAIGAVVSAAVAVRLIRTRGPSEVTLTATVTGEDGRPLDGVARISGRGWPEPIRQNFTGGRLQINLVAGQEYAVDIDSKDFIGATKTLHAPAKGPWSEAFQLRFAPGAASPPADISGTVLDEAGPPLAGVVDVFVWESATQRLTPVLSAKTDEKGRYHFKLKEPLTRPDSGRAFQAQARADGFRPALKPLPPGTRCVNFKLARSTDEYRPRVVSRETGAPIKGAEIMLGWSDPATREGAVHFYATDEEGRALFIGIVRDRGQYNILVEARGFTFQFHTVPSAELPDVFTLDGAGRWSGRVVEVPARRALAGAEIHVRMPFGQDAVGRSDSGGAFQIDGLPVGSPLIFSASLAGFAQVPTDDDPVIDPGRRAAERDVEMVASTTLGGIVVDDRDAPIAEAEITATVAESSFGQTASGRTRTATSDASGRFRLDGLLPRATWTLQAEHPAYVTARLHPVEPERTPEVRLVMTAGGGIRGRAYYEGSGRPAEGWRVRIEGASAESILTDSNGDYGLERLPPGDTRVTCARDEAAPPFETSVRVEAGRDTIVDIPLPEPGALVGSAARADGKPPAGLVLKLECDGAARALDVPVSGGSYRVADLSPGAYQVSARCEGCRALAPATVRIGPGAAARLDLVFSAGRTIRGRVFDRTTGAAVPNAAVTAYAYPADDSNSGPGELDLTTTGAATGADGTFELPGLPDGPVRIDVEHESFCRWSSGPAYARGSPPASLDVAMSRGGIVEVAIADAKGAPRPGLHVVLDSKTPGLFTGGKTTDDAGRARFDRVPPGAYAVWFVAASGTVTRDLTVSEGQALREAITAEP